MEFYKYTDSWSFLKQFNLQSHFESREQWWELQEYISETHDSPFMYRRVLLEKKWIANERPYYHCYPAILPMLMKLKLDIPCSSLRGVEVEPIEVRLPKDQKDGPFAWGEHHVRTVFFGIQKMPREVGSEELIDGICICFDIGEVSDLNEPIYSFRFFPLRDDLTIDEASKLFTKHHTADEGVQMPVEIAENIIKLCACLALISQDSELITPDVLKKHEKEWDQADEERRKQMVEMAKNRGKNGWNVGAEIEYSPHYRRPHPALVRVGKGRISARIVMRRGSVVHRTKITNIPSGFDGNG
jgi:hypothetical protein